MTSVTVREYTADDLDSMIPIWNEVIEEGIAFPQEDFLNRETAPDFFAEQSYCGVAADDSGRILGLYILHPNNVGRCGHICNASYAVSSASRGLHIGEKLVLDRIAQARRIGFQMDKPACPPGSLPAGINKEEFHGSTYISYKGKPDAGQELSCTGKTGV